MNIWDGVDGDADEPRSGETSVVGSVQQRKQKVLTRTRTERKKAVIVSVWLKKVIKSYNNMNN
jgi:hypothetical protein